MAKLLLFTLLGTVLLLSAAQASVLSPELNSNSVSTSTHKDQYATVDPLAASGDDDNIVDEGLVDLADEIADDNEIENELTEEEKKIGDHIEFPVNEMDDEELKLYLALEERIFLGQADEHVAFQILKEKRSLYTKKGGNLVRRKRIAPLVARVAFGVARSLASRFARSGITRSGTRVTRHYNGRGSFSDAVRDFNRMRPSNVRSFNGKISGQTGTLGRHRVTVRDGSKGNSRPTLEIRSHGGDLVRKFRYNN
ncbi:uncharacterized protein LOC143285098 [Babylonia areolata]|uniref:uncharacterized protein LOC143285098 n=1 Tax=Babylonia areolata TaxID=304850 RepID=UPI003FD4ACDE